MQIIPYTTKYVSDIIVRIPIYHYLVSHLVMATV